MNKDIRSFFSQTSYRLVGEQSDETGTGGMGPHLPGLPNPSDDMKDERMNHQTKEHQPAMIPRSNRGVWAYLSGIAVAAAMFMAPTPGLAAPDQAAPAAAGQVPVPKGQDGCLLCHKYPGLGRYDKDAKNRIVKRVFYVNEDIHKASYHGRFNCSDCHEGVGKIPHTDAKKVDCGKTCHVNEPSSGKKFSHKAIVEDLEKSAHGAKNSNTENPADLPACRDCHTNKPYLLSVQQQVKSKASMEICHQCHEETAWIDRFLRHINYRLSMRRPSSEVVRLCSKCHANPDMMARHKLDVVVGFQDTYHGKAIQYGDQEVANCLNCHAPYATGFSPHRITSKKKENSPVNPANKRETCAQAGCHPAATKEFATDSRAHPSQIKLARLTKEGAGGADSGLQNEAFQAKVLYWINLFYQLLIAGVVAGLGGHRLLDLYATYRDGKKGGH